MREVTESAAQREKRAENNLSNLRNFWDFMKGPWGQIKETGIWYFYFTAYLYFPLYHYLFIFTRSPLVILKELYCANSRTPFGHRARQDQGILMALI